MSIEGQAESTRVALYMRASTEMQKYSVQQQGTLLTTYAAARGYLIVRSYVDDGRSGLTLAGRPGLQALLADVVGGGADFSRVLVLDVSRWGRFQDPDEAAHYEYLCHEGGVAIDYCYEAFENGPGAMVALMKSIKRIMAAEFSREMGVRIAHSRRLEVQRGFAMGGTPPYGFRRVLVRDGRVVKVMALGDHKALRSDKIRFVHGPQEELDTIREVFRKYLAGGATRPGIAREIAAAGGPSLTHYRIRGILENELVTGVYVFNRTAKPLRGPRLTKPEDEVIRIKVLPPLISPEDFAAAQEVRRTQTPACYDDDEFIAKLKALLSEHDCLTFPIISAGLGARGVKALRRHFGSIGRACELAGYPWYRLTPTRLLSGGVLKAPFRERRSKEDMIAALRDLLTREGRLSEGLIRNDKNCAATRTLIQRFGSVRAACELAGYELGPRKTKAKDEDLLGRLIPLARKYAVLTSTHILNSPGAPHPQTVKKHFGSYENARRLALELDRERERLSER